VDCTIEAEHPAGDHWIVVARVTDLRVRDGDPLVFYDSSYLSLRAPR
jgi:flavin reductase ActVB